MPEASLLRSSLDGPRSGLPEIQRFFSLPTIVSTAKIVRTIAIVPDTLVIRQAEPAELIAKA